MEVPLCVKAPHPALTRHPPPEGEGKGTAFRVEDSSCVVNGSLVSPFGGDVAYGDRGGKHSNPARVAVRRQRGQAHTIFRRDGIFCCSTRADVV